MNQTEKIQESLRIACADFVDQLPMGLDTILGERGLGLSEGQVQRIAIARALFSERPILMLDESTSALDAGTEQALLRNLRKITDKTVVFISHRQAAVNSCDRVISF